MLLKEHDPYIYLCIQTSKPFELQDRAKYQLLKKNNGFISLPIFREIETKLDTKTVPNGLRTQRIKRKTKQNERNLTEISPKQGEK